MSLYSVLQRRRGRPVGPSWKSSKTLFQEDVAQMKGKVHATTSICIAGRWRKACPVDGTLRQEADRSAVPWHHTALCPHCPRGDPRGGAGAGGQCLANHYQVWPELSDQSGVRSCP